MVGEETAPNKAASQSDLRIETVSSGRAVPVSWKAAQPARRGVKLNLRVGVCRASRTRRPEVRTSLPIPSPGMRPVVGGISWEGHGGL